MLLVGCAATTWGSNKSETLRMWTVGGCAASAVALTSLVAAALVGIGWPLKISVFMLGFTNGMFAVAAIGSMFSFALGDTQGREGIRMGLFGASQAIAFGIGGFAGTALVDVTRYITGAPVTAFAVVFATEAFMFLAAALLAFRLAAPLRGTELANPLALAVGHRPNTFGN
jgi:BCD family chlorophyll transporter-like MFS transporter